MARALLLLAVCCLCADAVAPAAPARRRWQLSPADASAMSPADAATVAAVLLELSGGGGGGGALRGSIGGALRAAGADMAPPPEQGASSGEDATAADASSKTAKTPKCPKSKLGVCNGKGDCDEACVASHRAPRTARRAPAFRPFFPRHRLSLLSLLCVATLPSPGASLQHWQVHMQGELG